MEQGQGRQESTTNSGRVGEGARRLNRGSRLLEKVIKLSRELELHAADTSLDLDPSVVGG